MKRDMKPKSLSIYLWCIVLAVLLALLLREAWVVAVDHVLLPDWKSFEWKRLSWPNVFKNFNLGLYWWFMVGIAIYPLLRRYLAPRSKWLQGVLQYTETDSHESVHEKVAILLGRDVHEKVVKQNSGHILSSGPKWSRPFTSLAPYTFPYITYIGLALRSLIDIRHTWLFDIFLGMTLGFYLVRFFLETRVKQPDIHQFSTIWFPRLYITVWMVFNFNLFAVSFWSNKNLFTAFWWVIQHLFIW